MKIYLAADHAGFYKKEKLKAFLLREGYSIEDCGAKELDKNDDWPDFVAKACEKISAFPEDRAILVAGSGEGEAMLANKYLHVRAALFYGTKMPTEPIDVTGKTSTDPYELIKLTRVHNNANVLSLGSRFLTDEEMYEAVKIWLTTTFLEEERHVRRLKKMADIEKTFHE